MSALILEDKVKNNRDLFVRGVRVVAAATRSAGKNQKPPER